ncbi:unnamed protein product [Eruca vesicaria subsp. sativa]|uniref:Calmodulin-binding domain-containing protein n=1 Tax=Eruca vesicaria subsp. sativa TaxID=29727 RepID=A0ABC8J9Y0_ERUVS|nr:unnamed protein product [Eruca vesicaria subsp. sativa]
MAEENVSQVKEMMMMIPNDEHCCFDDYAKPTSVETTMPPLMVEEIQGDDEEDVLLTPPPPPAAVVSSGSVNPRRHSTGALGKAQAQTRYRGNQTSSTHDLCKHGKRREEDVVIKPWKLVKKKDVESGGGDLVKGEGVSVVRKSLLVAKRDAATTSEVVKSYDGLLRAKRSETKTPSDSPAAGVRMVKKTNADVKKVSMSSENKEDVVKSLKKKEKKTETDDVVEKKATRISESKSSKEDLVKTLKKKEIDEAVRCDDVVEKTLYVVESSIEENKKMITSVKSEIQKSSEKKILRGSGKNRPTLIPSLSPSSEKVKDPRVTKSDPRPIRKTTLRSKTGLSEKNESSSATLVTKPKRIGLKLTPPPSGLPTRPGSFRKGKVHEPKQEDSTSTSIKLKKRVVQEPKLRSDGSKKKKNLKDVGKVSSYNSGEGKREKVVLRHRKVEAKKKLQTLFNNVIEETVNKLEEVRKSKVKALVGAFETVISLQDNDVNTHKKKKVQSKSASSQVVEG